MEDREYKVQLTASVVIGDVLGVEALASTLGMTHRSEAVRKVVHDGLAVAVVEKMRRLGYGVGVHDNTNEYAAHMDCRFFALDDEGGRGMVVRDTFAEAVRLAAATTLDLGEDATWVEILEVEEDGDDAS